MDISREEREELNALSKDLFGVASKWQKMFKGVTEMITKTIVETVPGEKGAPDITKEVKVPVVTANGSKTYTTRAYTAQEIKDKLLVLKTSRDEYIAKMKEQEAKKQLEQRVANEASGSARA